MSDPERKENGLVRKAEDSHHDVGIVGLWFGLNYGSILTYYALYEIVNAMGHSAMMVNKPEVLWRPKYADRETVANKFIYKYCGEENITSCYHSSMDYKALNKVCDTFIVGSDVVWNYQICGGAVGQFFFLDFVRDDKKKIAMASSFGSGYDAPEEDRLRSEQCMKKFDYIGVRENEAVSICNEVFGVQADKIMDPVFLCDRNVYHRLADNSEVSEDKNYVSSYILGPGTEKAELLQKIAAGLNCELRCLPNPNNPDNFTKKTGLPAIKDPSVEDWLYYFKHTQCYVGDSFHGLCFSIIFERPFVVIVNRGQSLARFRTLLKTIGYENRMINIDDDDMSEDVINQRIKDILAQPIDYEKVTAIIKEQAAVSYDWLKKAIESKKEAKKAEDARPETVRNKKMDGLDPINVSGVPEELCTGCSACMNVCPVNAIKMKPNSDGFIVPVIDNEKCTKCTKCIRTCPAVNTRLTNSPTPRVIAAMADDETRMGSSSGGVFTVAAEKIIDLGGYVCGAVLEYDKLQVSHKIVNTKEELQALRGSKYFQSDMGLIYRDIKKLLKNEELVLFTGTPCQVAGLKAYLGRDYDNLYCIDILCHGVPSRELFKKYIDEAAASPELNPDGAPLKPTAIYFRDKERHGWRSSSYIRIEFDNGAVYESSLKEGDSFEKVFHEKYALRKSCADCIFCAFPRQGDFSMGDFWGITQYNKSMDDGKGTSIVFINNPHGKELFESLKPSLSKTVPMKLQAQEIKKNRVRALYPASSERERFLSLIKTRSLAESVRLTDTKHYDIGLAVNFYAVNFGGALTHYALYHTLEDLGYSTLMIERPATSKNIGAVTDSYRQIHLRPLYPDYAVSKTYADKTEMRKFLNPKCDMFMVGSDKLFNFVLYTALDKYTSLDWVEDSKKKIAYSASFGRTMGDPKVHREMSYFLKKFDHFSVRENDTVDTVKNVYGVSKDVEWVLDPVFLCDPKHYKALIDRCERKTPENYVSSYILDPTEEKQAILRTVMDKLSVECEVFSEYKRPDKYFEPLGDLYKEPLHTEERLQSIANCKYFVTDSFHGMCFAILNRKPFVAIVNKRRGANRFYSIAKMLGVEDRLIESIDELTDERLTSEIDYDRVFAVIDRERARCIEWLKNALEAPKVNSMSDYDMMLKLLDRQDEKIDVIKGLILGISENLSSKLSDKTDIFDYFDTLEEKKKGNIIIISVKDTPGLALDSFVAKKIKDLGFKSDLEGKHAHSFIGILNGGTVIFERLGEKEDEPTETNLKFGKFRLHVTSRTYRNGNEAIIDINGTDYSKDGRGLNIVVYNKQKEKLIDSVCFDTHFGDFKCTR